jgi:hypothetical protein
MSNFIHIQQPVRRVETDLLGFHIDLDADRPMEGDENLLPSAFYEQQFGRSDGKDVPNATNASAVRPKDPAADELEKIEFVLRPLPQGSFGKMNVQTSQTVGLRKRIDPLQLKVIILPPPDQKIDFIFLERPLFSDKNALQIDAIRRRDMMESEPEMSCFPLAS